MHRYGVCRRGVSGIAQWAMLMFAFKKQSGSVGAGAGNGCFETVCTFLIILKSRRDIAFSPPENNRSDTHCFCRLPRRYV